MNTKLVSYNQKHTKLNTQKTDNKYCNNGHVEEDINTRLAKAAAVFRRLDNVWRYSMLSLKIKLDLYTSLIVSTAIYASETWKSTARIRQQLDVFHQRNLQKILGIMWKDHATNMEVLSRTGQRRLQDIVAGRRLRMAGHIIRMPPRRPANHPMSWTPSGSSRRLGRPRKTWRSTFKEDLVDRGVSANTVKHYFLMHLIFENFTSSIKS